MDQPIQTTVGVVAAKEGVYDTAVPEMDPHGDPLFRVAFRTPEGVKIFWINSFDYYALEVGMKGELRYQGDTLLSFGHWIQQSFNLDGSRK